MLAITTTTTTTTLTLAAGIMNPHIPSGATSSATLSNKEKHYAQLAAKLGALATTFDTTKQHLNLAAEQAFYMRKLGIAQASTFMAMLTEIDREQEATSEEPQS